MYKTFVIYIYIFFYLYESCSFAQSVYFPVYHHESENGLVHLNVLSIQEDDKNTLYFVTQGGLYEYTGQSFHRKREYSFLKNIRNVFFNDSTLFLIYRDRGLFVVNQNTVVPFFPVNPFKKPSDKIILDDRYCYNYTDQVSVEIYDHKNKIYYNDSILLEDNTNQAFCIQQINHKVLVGRRKGLYVIENGKVTCMEQLSKIPVFSLFHNMEKHLIFLGSSGKIILIDDSLFRIQRIISIEANLPNKSDQFIFKLEKNISKILVDKYNRIWFCIQPDDNIYLMENNQIYDVLDVLNILPTLINDIYLDKFNNIWIGTFNDGVYQIVSTYWQSYRITQYQRILNVKMLEKDDSKIYFATNNGLFYSDTNHINIFHNIIAPDNFFNIEIHDVENFKQGMYATNINAFDVKKYKVDNAIVNVLPFKHFAVKDNDICYVSDITNNVLLFRKNTVIDTIYKPSDYKLNVHQLYYKNKELFIATNKGLIVFNETTKKFTTLFQNNEIQKTLDIDNQIYVVYQNKIYNYSDKKTFFDAERYNLSVLTDFEKYKDYYIVASEEGLLLLDKNLNPLNYFGRKNGLISNIINDILILNNYIILATDKGISYTSISNILNYTIDLNIPVLKYIVANNDTFIYRKNYPIILNKNTQDIYFHIIGSNFNPLAKVTFQYALNNSEWINFENSPLHISAIAGGNYTLKIRATTDQIHYTAPLTIEFKKELRLSEKKWFWRLVAFMSVFMTLSAIFIIREIEKNKTARKLKNIQQMNLLKHQAMNAILSPHFIFNSLTGIQNYILRNDVDKASDYLSKFSRLIRMIIEKASQPNITLQDEIKRLQFYLELEKERFGDKFDFVINIDEKINLENVEIPNMIIQPYLENSILHGILPKKERGHLSLSFSLKDNKFIEVTIEDDGIGIIKGTEKKIKHHKSLAMQTISEILKINTQLYQKQQSVQIIDKSDTNKNQTGTIVKILIEL